MKRRDLLKGTGALVLGTPAVCAAALLKSNAQPTPQAQPKDLVVAFNGPFCFWHGVPPGSGNQDCTQCITVMAPPVGPLYHDHKIRHQPWVGTTTNEIAINVSPGATLTLLIDGYKPPATSSHSGTKSFTYEQKQETGATPLFNLMLPVPDIIIGVRPTAVMMVCVKPTDPYCTNYIVYSSGLSFVYKNVALDGVDIKLETQNGPVEFFKPCFTNDADLKDATLGVHLTPLDRNPDVGHKHAQLVWAKMLSMYPWMQKEITGIDFCPDFNPASCDPQQCETRPLESGHKKAESGHKKTESGRTTAMFGPGDDCQVPIMTLPKP